MTYMTPEEVAHDIDDLMHAKGQRRRWEEARMYEGTRFEETMERVTMQINEIAAALEVSFGDAAYHLNRRSSRREALLISAAVVERAIASSDIHAWREMSAFDRRFWVF